MPTTTEAEIYDAVQQKMDRAPIEKIVGKPTTTTVDKMELQMGRCVAGIRTDQWGGNHGHLALIVNDAKLQTLTGDATMTVAKMAKPGNLPTGLTNTTPAIVKSRLMAQHRVDETNYTTMIVVEEVAVQKICTEIVEPMYVEELEDEFLGFKNKSIKEVIKYVRDTWCTVTTLEKEEALKEFAQPWRRGEEHVTAYCRRLDKQQKRCQELGAAAEDKTKVHMYVKCMYATDIFDEKDMMTYEEKSEADRSWAATKTYFNTIIARKDKFAEERTARREGYESANSFGDTGSVTSNGSSYPPSNISPSNLATFDRTSMTAYTNELEGVLSDKTDEIAALTTSNEQLLKALETQHQQQQQAMQAMQTKMNKDMMDMFSKMMAGQQCQPTAPSGNTGGSGGGGGREPRYCNICKKKDQYHEDNDCWEKPGNEKKAPKKIREKLLKKKKEGENK